MTAIAPEPTAPAAAPVVDPPAVDLHAPKLSPDDPRLRVRRPTARTLRAGPLVAIAAGLSCVLVFAIAVALQPPRAAGKDRPEPSGTPAPPIVPDAIKNAPSMPAPTFDRDAGWPRRGEVSAAGARAATPSPEEVQRRLEQDQELKAQHADILFESRAGAGAELPRSSEPLPMVPAAGAPAGGPSSPPGESDPNLQDHKNAFLDGVGARPGDSLAATIRHPRSPYEVLAGTIVPAVLVTGINSDLPGPVIGQVREHVYDTVTGNILLIPQGSRLLAHYDSMVAWGQERVLVCWNRLVFPNGDSIDLQCMPAADLAGAAGLTDDVDEHWARLIKGAAVASLLAATTTAVAGNTEGYQPTIPQIWARNAAGEVNQVGLQLTRRNLAIQPTITVRPGYSVNVIITKDIVLAPYRESLGPGGGR